MKVWAGQELPLTSPGVIPDTKNCGTRSSSQIPEGHFGSRTDLKGLVLPGEVPRSPGGEPDAILMALECHSHREITHRVFSFLYLAILPFLPWLLDQEQESRNHYRFHADLTYIMYIPAPSDRSLIPDAQLRTTFSLQFLQPEESDSQGIYSGTDLTGGNRVKLFLPWGSDSFQI
ncbi:hypothetical protein BS47DRAFT_1364861 [Hydnum rufescens UP504]|uniref:Uncharacterized protein n=1 Tax=Hydnum rufescens UP504 TaxID=1448309 RepID=A0A9P6DTU9_9AGAM|nr:hypothetical protein BS47DRAFT_1364861 [Hydnum rufescens UP504]